MSVVSSTMKFKTRNARNKYFNWFEKKSPFGKGQSNSVHFANNEKKIYLYYNHGRFPFLGK